MLDYILPPHKAKSIDVTWHTVGPTPMAAKKYAPQGMTFINGDLIMAESWNDTKTVLYVLRGDESGYQVISQVEMPPEAVHTSGLEWDGVYLWAVDFVSNRLYKINWQNSIDSGSVDVLDSCATGLKGSGSIARLRIDDTEVVAISDFMNTGRTYFVPTAKAFDDKGIPEKSIASYRNAYFVQGLMAKDGYLYETTNSLGLDVIYKIDTKLAIESEDYSNAVVARYEGPSKMIEDLAFDGTNWWTSDESSYSLYTTKGIE